MDFLTCKLLSPLDKTVHKDKQCLGYTISPNTKKHYSLSMKQVLINTQSSTIAQLDAHSRFILIDAEWTHLSAAAALCPVSVLCATLCCMRNNVG